MRNEMDTNEMMEKAVLGAAEKSSHFNRLLVDTDVRRVIQETFHIYSESLPQTSDDIISRLADAICTAFSLNDYKHYYSNINLRLYHIPKGYKFPGWAYSYNPPVSIEKALERLGPEFSQGTETLLSTLSVDDQLLLMRTYTQHNVSEHIRMGADKLRVALLRIISDSPVIPDEAPQRDTLAGEKRYDIVGTQHVLSPINSEAAVKKYKGGSDNDNQS